LVGATPRQVRAVIDRLFRDGAAVSRADRSKHELFPVGIPAAEGECLREWVKRENAATTIEIGLGYAISTLFICEGLLANKPEGARHLAIDPNQARRFANCGLQFVEDAGVHEMLEFHAKPSEILLPRLVGEGRGFDFAFVDGNHRFDGVFVDLFYLGRLIRPGGIIFVDDYQLPGIARAASFFVKNLDWTLEEESAADPVHQWAVLRTAKGPDKRHFHVLRRLLEIWVT